MSKAVEKIVIVGSGLVASMTAAYLAKQSFSKIKIVCVEDPKHKEPFFEPCSDPFFRNFLFSFEDFEVNYLASMKGSYCLASLYEDFGKFHKKAFLCFDPLLSQPFKGYFLFEHYLAAHFRGQTLDFVYNPTPYLCEQAKAPFLANDKPFFGASGGSYGYLFDPSACNQLFREIAMGAGVSFFSSIVKSCVFHSDGRIKAVQSKDGDLFEADFFIDCADGLMLQKALKQPFLEDGNLSGLFFQEERKEGPLEPYYSQKAMENGRLLKWPLREKNLFLYLFEPWKQSEEEAKELFSDKDVQKFDFRLGSVERPWVKNVLGLGSSAACFDPRANLQYQVLIKSLEELIGHFPFKEKNEELALSYNRALLSHIEEARCFAMAHHVFEKISPPRRLQRIIDDWKGACLPRISPSNSLGNNEALLGRCIALFTILGFLPDKMPAALRLLGQEHIEGLKNMQKNYQMAASNFPDHRQFLQFLDEQRDMSRVDPGFFESKNSYLASDIQSQTSLLKDPYGPD